VDVARRRGAERGLGNVDYRLMDAERIELEADSVDGVLCRFGYMLVPDPAAALAEARRVMRPGGRLALAVWSAPERNPWVTLALGLLVERGHLPAPDPGAPSPFALANASRTQELLEAAGFTSVRTEEIPIRFTFRDLDEYNAFTTDTGGPAAPILQRMPQGEREALTAQLRAAFARFETDGHYELPGLALAAVALSPETADHRGQQRGRSASRSARSRAPRV